MTNTPSERLQAARRSKGYKTAKDAAEAFGWSPHTYKSHEDGVRNMKPDVAKVYEDALGLAEGYLIYGHAKKENSASPKSKRWEVTEMLDRFDALDAAQQEEFLSRAIVSKKTHAAHTSILSSEEDPKTDGKRGVK
jgi:hypothetical protein